MGTLAAAPGLSASSTSAGALATGSALKSRETTATTNSGFANGNLPTSVGGQFGVGGGTTEQKFGGMVNVLYDFNGLTPWFVPYIGAGVGYLGITEKWHTNNNFGAHGAAW